MIKAIIFDLDNTLVDFMLMKRRAIEAAIPAMIDAGLNLPANTISNLIDEIYKEYGIEYQKVFDELLNKTIGRVDYKILSSAIVAYRRAREATLVPYPNVFPTLVQLIKMGLKLGIVSDAPALEAWLRLSSLNFQYLFDSIVTFDDSKARKPSPEPFILVLKKLGVEPQEALMVGDWAERDIVGASQLGMKTAFARYGDTFNTQNPNSDFELNDISELIDIIKKENNLI